MMNGQTFAACRWSEVAGFISRGNAGWYVVRALNRLGSPRWRAWRQDNCFTRTRDDGRNDEGRTSAVKRMLLLAQKEHRYGKNRRFAERPCLKRHQGCWISGGIPARIA